MRKNDETQDQFSGQTLPGTGGDYVDANDVEGHRARAQKAVQDEAGPEGQRHLSKAADDGTDVEGHRASTQKAVDDGAGPEGQRHLSKAADDQDVEGHRAPTQKAIDDEVGPDGLYRGGPTTQGEVIRRGPSDNPNGDR